MQDILIFSAIEDVVCVLRRFTLVASISWIFRDRRITLLRSILIVGLCPI